MYPKTKSTLFSRHTLSLTLAFLLVALVAGVYFLFKPFPAGPSLEVKANVPAAVSVAGWSAYANAPIVVIKSVSAVDWFASAHAPAVEIKSVSAVDWSASVNAPVAMKEAASVAGWSAYANAPVVVKEAASVAGWSAYANPRTIIDISALRLPMHIK
jgi:hypothetical protein